MTDKETAKYKEDVKEAAKLLVQIGVFDNLDTNADLVEAVKAVIRKSEIHEKALYGEVLSEDQLRAQIEQRENESNKLKTQIEELEKRLTKENILNIRQALANQKFLEEEMKKGGTLYIKNANNDLSKVNLPTLKQSKQDKSDD